ncbi:hypothetical protein PR202_ga10260 [Eleusine coracana subsp. coracana]|uniref:Uncharacterized protein n=1 Tax=Eleusine coracana subsp. coracana TaxID=191504 RepID=A0AAV5C6B4_ELECO|nr:hypothetical protein PR202_ga10260 [Eleusine coracana subsp. coracana]
MSRAGNHAAFTWPCPCTDPASAAFTSCGGVWWPYAIAGDPSRRVGEPDPANARRRQAWDPWQRAAHRVSDSPEQRAEAANQVTPSGRSYRQPDDSPF